MVRSSYSPQQHTSRQRRFVVIIAVLMINAALAHEPDELEAGWTTAELRTGHHHALTMPLVREMAAIGRELNQLAAQHPETCQWMNQIIGPETLARQVRAFNDYTRVRRVIEAHLPVQQYLLTLHVLNKTSTSVHAAEHGIAEPTGMSAENIRFYRANRREIETLLDEPDPC